jgi:hypothetical protein
LKPMLLFPSLSSAEVKNHLKQMPQRVRQLLFNADPGLWIKIFH